MLRPSALALAALATACVPDVGEPPWSIDRPRLLAVRFEPAEVAAGEPFEVEALVVDERGRAVEAPVDWTVCSTPTRLSDAGSVSPACARGERGARLQPGVRARGQVAPEACAWFGPEAAPGDVRPRDPDRTGGYYQPVRAEVDGEVVVGMLRLRCAYADVPVDAVRELAARNGPNLPPGPIDLRVEARHRDGLTLRARLAAGAERYGLYDVARDRVVTQTERLVASIFVAGAAASASRVELADERPATPELDWTLRLGEVEEGAAAWVVVRDDRGGVAWDGGPLDP